MKRLISVLFLLLAMCGQGWANDYYNASGAPSAGSSLSSSVIRSEYESVEDGFDKMSPLTGNGGLPVFVNAGGTGQEAVSYATARTYLGISPFAGNASLPVFINAGETAQEAVSYATARTYLGITPIGANGGYAVFINAGATAQEAVSIVDAQSKLGISTISGNANLPVFINAGATAQEAISASDARTKLGISATNTPNTPAGNIAATDVQSALNELDTEKFAAASAIAANITNTPAGTISAVNVQTALNELDTEKVASSALTASIVDNVASGDIAATNVQDAIDELDAERLIAPSGVTITGGIGGLEITNDGTDPDADIVFAPGVCMDGTGEDRISNASYMTKRLDATWTAGTGGGGRISGSTLAANMLYHVYAIRKTSDGSADFLFVPKGASFAYPSGYSANRWLGYIVTDGSADILPFRWTGDWITWRAPITVASTLTSATFADVDMSDYVPSSGAIELVMLGCYSAAGSGTMDVVFSTQGTTGDGFIDVCDAGSGEFAENHPPAIVVPKSGHIYYRRDGTGTINAIMLKAVKLYR